MAAMEIAVVDNVSRRAGAEISSHLKESSDSRIAVAFVSMSGLAILDPAMQAALSANSTVELLVGLDLHGTEPRALKTLVEMSSVYRNLSIYCMGSLAPSSVYHPKLYIFRCNGDATCLVGSSNLTAGGLRANVEVNLQVRGSLEDEVISELFGTYLSLKFHKNRVIPDLELVELYHQAFDAEKRANLSTRQALRGVERAFADKVATLRKPKAQSSDLVGWLKLVYELLPSGEFGNEDVYTFEAELQRRYPANLNVRAKVRQQLQVLRDMGLLDHVGIGRWRTPTQGT